MRARIAVAVCAALVLVAGGVVWWSLQGDPDQPGASVTAPPSPPVGKPVAACASAQPSDRIPDAFWGMHVASPIGDDFPDAPIGAVNLTTSQVYWNKVETAPGSYDFSRVDDIVDTAEDRGAQPMLVLGFTPSFHADTESPTARATMPDEEAWRAWVTAAVDRYGDRLDYQVWPEPNIAGNWTGTPEQMGRLTAIAGEVIHDRASDALVVAPATTLRMAAQREWISRFWATAVDGAPVADHVDAVALDPFPMEDGSPEDALDLVCLAREILANRGVDLPIWTNEINYGVPSGGGATDVQPYPDGQQAALVARTYLLHAAMGIDRVYWLGWGSYPGMAVELERDGATTPAGVAYGIVREWLAGGSGPVCRVNDGIHTCVVNNDENVLRIHWRERGTSTVPVGGGQEWVQTLDGERRQLEAGDVVRVDQEPVAIVGPQRP